MPNSAAKGMIEIRHISETVKQRDVEDARW